MILNGTPEEWVALWGAIEDEMQDSTEKGLTIIFSVHEVETVCAVKMMQVRSHSLHVAEQLCNDKAARELCQTPSVSLIWSLQTTPQTAQLTKCWLFTRLVGTASRVRRRRIPCLSEQHQLCAATVCHRWPCAPRASSSHSTQ
jgi:hypothetical protein